MSEHGHGGAEVGPIIESAHTSALQALAGTAVHAPFDIAVWWFLDAVGSGTHSTAASNAGGGGHGGGHGGH